MSDSGRFIFHFVLGFILNIAWISAQENQPSEESEQPFTREIHTDQWAGIPVAGPQHVNAMMAERVNNAPKLGESAPEILLADALDGSMFSLHKACHYGPVVLVFGSYSCITAQESMEAVRSVWERYRDRAQFYFIYVREAHPRGGFAPPERGLPYVINSAESFGNRALNAVQFIRQGLVPFPIKVDAMDDRTAVRWSAWPVRIFVVDGERKVSYAGQSGPWFFKPTRNFDPNLGKVPFLSKDMPGFSKESLEEYLETLPKIK